MRGLQIALVMFALCSCVGGAFADYTCSNPKANATAPRDGAQFYPGSTLTQASIHYITVARPNGDGPTEFQFEWYNVNNDNGKEAPITSQPLRMDVNAPAKTYTGNPNTTSGVVGPPGGYIVQAITFFWNFGSPPQPEAYGNANFTVLQPPMPGGAPEGVVGP